MDGKDDFIRVVLNLFNSNDQLADIMTKSLKTLSAECFSTQAIPDNPEFTYLQLQNCKTNK